MTSCTQPHVNRRVCSIPNHSMVPCLLPWTPVSANQITMLRARPTSTAPELQRARACEPTSSRIQGLLAARATAAHLSR